MNTKNKHTDQAAAQLLVILSDVISAGVDNGLPNPIDNTISVRGAVSDAIIRLGYEAHLNSYYKTGDLPAMTVDNSDAVLFDIEEV